MSRWLLAAIVDPQLSSSLSRNVLRMKMRENGSGTTKPKVRVEMGGGAKLMPRNARHAISGIFDQ